MAERRKSSYVEKFKDPRWQRMRLAVFERDKWRCRKCHSTDKTLNAHHLYYLESHEPWEYDLSALLTLCEDCHEAETVALRVNERRLIHALKCFGLMADDMEMIADALSDAPPPKNKPHLLLTLWDLFQDESFRDRIVDLWRDKSDLELKKTRERGEIK